MTRLRQLLCAALPALILFLAPQAASGAGMTTHAWMAEIGFEQVRYPELRALLNAQRDTVITGAAYPDSGYLTRDANYPGGDYGEVSHWGVFTDAYIAQIKSKPECAGTYSNPAGPCAGLIAHMMGAAAHGLGDETWDWMFEPQMPDHGEHPYTRDRVDDQPGWTQLGEIPVIGMTAQQIALQIDRATIGSEGNPFGSLVNSPEYNMDAIAITDHGRVTWGNIPPPTADLVEVYDRIELRHRDNKEITADGITAGHTAVQGVQGAQRLSTIDASSIRISFPWSSANFLRAPGGTFPSARMIAGLYEGLWRKLNSPTHPRPEVIGTNPTPGATGVSTIFGGNNTSPGPGNPGDASPRGAERRIIAVLSNGFHPDVNRFQPGTMRVFDEHGAAVAPRAGYPFTGPYGGPGVHSLFFAPQTNLSPCTTYTVEVTTSLVDHAGASLKQPYRWAFTTTGC